MGAAGNCFVWGGTTDVHIAERHPGAAFAAVAIRRKLHSLPAGLPRFVRNGVNLPKSAEAQKARVSRHSMRPFARFKP